MPQLNLIRPSSYSKKYWQLFDFVLSCLFKLAMVVLILSILLSIYSLFGKKIPDSKDVSYNILTKEPVQGAVSLNPFTQDYKGYEYSINPKYSYDIYGLVVSYFDYDSFLNIIHKDDPGNAMDFCVIWGENITNNVYKEMKFRSSEFKCFWKKESNSKFSNLYLSNNHLIPANMSIKALLKKVNIGDQIHIKGYLADYSISKNKEQVGTRQTSITRSDEGDGACEIIYVTDFEIIKKSKNIASYMNIYINLIWGLIIVLVLSFFVKYVIVYDKIKENKNTQETGGS